MTVDAIAVEHVPDWFASMADRPGSANRAMPVLSIMMRMAELWGYRPHNSNPCKNTKRYRMEPKERFLTAEEMARLNAVLTRDEFYRPQAVAVIRLLMLTGCRRGEVVSLEWDWIRGKRIHLPDSKSGPRTVWLSSAARAVIDAIPRYRSDCPLYDVGANAINMRDSKTGPRAVPLGEAARSHIQMLRGARDPEAYLFPRHAEGRGQSSLTACWHAVCEDANLGRPRLHDLRHTAASHAVMSGENLPLVGELLGHRRHRTTARYAHLADGHLVEMAERVGCLIARAMEGAFSTPTKHISSKGWAILGPPHSQT